MQWHLLLFIVTLKFLLLLAIQHHHHRNNSSIENVEIKTEKKYKFPIVFVFTIVNTVCKKGLPGYLKYSIEQAISQQVDCDVILASNYLDCPKINEITNTIKYLNKIDTSIIISNKTKEFRNISYNIFQDDGFSELWMTSALRFFILEDIMIAYGYKAMLHIEGDNMIYGNISSLLENFSRKYPGLAATPADINKVIWNIFVILCCNIFIIHHHCHCHL